MKAFVILGALLFASGALALPIDIEETEHRWALVPDGDSRMHLVDLNTIEPEPFFNSDTDTMMMLHTQSNPTAGQRLTFTTPLPSNWRHNAVTRVVIHGWNNDHNSPVMTRMTAAHLQSNNHNVVRIGWGAGANSNYVTSRNRVTAVGTTCARMLDHLNQHGGMPFGTLVITGHSLGGHIAGICGKRVNRGRVASITAMDPAGPMFSMGAPAERFAAGDAVYTEMIATNAGVLGFDQPLGRASFYPNFGVTMPGCGADLAGTCSHSRVVDFMVESINRPNGFMGRPCSYANIQNRSCPGGANNINMGSNSHSKSHTGVFFLTTNAGSPWGQG